jgi:hypothetical protein
MGAAASRLVGGARGANVVLVLAAAVAAAWHGSARARM